MLEHVCLHGSGDWAGGAEGISSNGWMWRSFLRRWGVGDAECVCGRWDPVGFLERSKVDVGVWRDEVFGPLLGSAS